MPIIFLRHNKQPVAYEGGGSVVIVSPWWLPMHYGSLPMGFGPKKHASCLFPGPKGDGLWVGVGSASQTSPSSEIGAVYKKVSLNTKKWVDQA